MTTLPDYYPPTAQLPEPGRRDVLSGARALGVAIAAVGVLAAVYALFVRSRRGQHLDQVALDHLGHSLDTSRSVATLLDTVTLGGLALMLAACVGIALVRRRWALAFGAVVLVAGSIATTEALKRQLLTRPSLGYGELNSLPSGHTTVVAALVLAGLLVVPRGGRWLVALAGSVGVSVTGVGTVIAGWHRPSDVVAALAVTLAWGSGVLAVLAITHGTEPRATPRARPTALVAGLAVAAGLFFALGVRPDGSATDLLIHLVTMCGLAAASAAVVGLFTWMVDTRYP